jgi:hypothetical protein
LDKVKSSAANNWWELYHLRCFFFPMIYRISSPTTISINISEALDVCRVWYWHWWFYFQKALSFRKKPHSKTLLS